MIVRKLNFCCVETMQFALWVDWFLGFFTSGIFKHYLIFIIYGSKTVFFGNDDLPKKIKSAKTIVLKKYYGG